MKFLAIVICLIHWVGIVTGYYSTHHWSNWDPDSYIHALLTILSGVLLADWEKQRLIATYAPKRDASASPDPQDSEESEASYAQNAMGVDNRGTGRSMPPQSHRTQK